MNLNKRQIKIFGIIAIGCIVLSVLFACAIVGFTVSLNYAKNHYLATYKENVGPYFNLTYDTMGCGDFACKYCNGRILQCFTASEMTNYSKFVYYSTLNGFQIASMVLTCVFVVTSIVFILLYIIAKKKENNYKF